MDSEQAQFRAVAKRLKRLERLLDRQAGLEAARLRVGRVEYPSADVYIRLDSIFELARLQGCRKEPWTARWIEDFVEDGETLYDVGANVGVFSLVAAKQPGRSIRTVAFEPACETFAALCHNVILNEVTDRVIPLPVGLAARTELSPFSYYDLASGAGIHILGEEPSRYIDYVPPYRQPVLAFALDELVERFALPAPHHLKLDVDGLELSVLDGASRTLRSPTMRSAMVEVEASDTDAVVALLADHGLTLHERYVREKHGAPVTSHWYGLFVKEGGASWR